MEEYEEEGINPIFFPHPVSPSGLPPLSQMQAKLDQDFQPSKGEGKHVFIILWLDRLFSGKIENPDPASGDGNANKFK